MIPLLETERLFLTKVGRSRSETDIGITGSDGSPVGRAHDRVGKAGQLGRLLGFLTRSSRFEWDVLDADDNRVLVVGKPPQRVRGPRPMVALADGTLVGHAVPSGLIGLPRVALLRGDDQPAGTLVPALGERREFPLLFFRIEDAAGAGVGEILHQTQGDWGFHVVFEPAADVTVRALAIAYTLCLIQERTTSSGL